MVRKQIYITKEQESYLKAQQIKEAELIRRALDEYIRRDDKKSMNPITGDWK